MALHGVMRNVMMWLARQLGNKHCDSEEVGHSKNDLFGILLGQKYFNFVQVYYDGLMVHVS